MKSYGLRKIIYHGLVLDCSIYSALATEILQSCIKPIDLIRVYELHESVSMLFPIQTNKAQTHGDIWSSDESSRGLEN